MVGFTETQPMIKSMKNQSPSTSKYNHTISNPKNTSTPDVSTKVNAGQSLKPSEIRKRVKENPKNP